MAHKVNHFHRTFNYSDGSRQEGTLHLQSSNNGFNSCWKFHLSLFKSTGDIVFLFFLGYILIVHPLKYGLCPTKFAYYQRIIRLVVFQLFVVSIIS